MTGRCATCKWWRPDGIDPMRGVSDFFGEGKGQCALTEMHMGDAVWPQSRAIAYDGEDYRASLVTTSDFGCVQWEAKE